MATFIGNEQFSVGGNKISLTMNDFWRWGYSDLSNNICRSVLAEFIVASSLEITNMDTERTRIMWRPYDLLTKDGCRVEVKSAAYVQSWDAKHPDHISFRIAPARLPDETGDYKDDAPLQRNSDVYVFCIYKALEKDKSPLNLDLWEFYVLATKVLDEKKPTQKTITLPSLMQLEPIWSDYYGIDEAIKENYDRLIISDGFFTEEIMEYYKLTKSENIKVAIYVRVSTLYQVDKDSLPMQKQDLLAYAKLILGTEDCVIFEDAGYSGKNTDRPKFQEMMSQIRTGAFTHLLVWKIDRISRNLLDFATMYKELKELGVVFVSKNEQFDTSTAMGEAMLKIILVFAELERNMTSERVTATMISRASNGQWNGGRIPFGFNWNADAKEFTINQDESAIVQLIHDLYEDMRSLVREARYLNENGYRTRAGNDWSPEALSIILRNVFYCGDYRYNMLKEGDRKKVKDESEWVTVENHHPAIISREQKQRILDILNSNSKINKQKNNYKSGKHTHIFAGLVLCGSCGTVMGAGPATARADGWIYSKYDCPTKRKSKIACNGKSTSDPIIGEFVFNYILNMLNVQRNFHKVSSLEQLQEYLLMGTTFSYIDHIDHEGLADLYYILDNGQVTGEIYGKGIKVKPKEKLVSEISSLRSKKQKLERGLDRLRNLYLYSDSEMSEREYVIERTKLEEKLDEVNEEIGMIQTDEWQQSVSDEMFVSIASEFIIAQKLSDRNYINYKRLAHSVDAKVLQSFVYSIIDNIIITDGHVERITFRNGLSHTFVFK